MNTGNLPQLFDLLDTLPNPVTLNELAYDDEGKPYDKIIYTNKSFLKTIGYTTEDIPDDRTWFTKAYPEASYQEYVMTEWFNAVQKAKDEESCLPGFTAKVYCKDGVYRWFKVTTQLEHTINHKFRTIVFIRIDSPHETRLKLDETKKALIEQEKLLRIQARQAAMGEMISMIAHQWKQPLTSIAAVSSNLKIQQMLGTPSKESINKQSDMILEQIEYLSQTITDFRDFFKQDKVIKQIEAQDAIDDALRIIGKLLLNSEIDLRTSYLSKEPFFTYPKELQHVFINLIKNAADILIEKVEKNRWIMVSTRDKDDTIVFEVSDNGGGIEDKIIERIFEPYFTTKGEQDGTGLGLYMTQTIIENHLKGSIGCKNGAEGAVFTVKLPKDFTNITKTK